MRLVVLLLDGARVLVGNMDADYFVAVVGVFLQEPLEGDVGIGVLVQANHHGA